MEYCDLHTHSYYSDGTDSPSKLIELAQKANLKAIALTDHNTTLGLNEFCESAKGSLVTPICGVELSTEYSGFEVHLLGLDLPKKSLNSVTDYCNDYLKRKKQSNIELVERLNEKGYKISYYELEKHTKNGLVNRSHIAAELVKNGYVKDVFTAFDKLLAEKAGIYKPCKRFDIFEAISFLKEIGAVPILAHPLLNFNEKDLVQFLPIAKKHGLLGMETVYSKFDDATINLLKKIADQNGLLQSGGSDYHGDYKPGFFVGIGKGNLKVDYTLADKILNTKR